MAESTMKIYVSHLRRGKYEEELYKPLLSSKLAEKHSFIFPHNKSQKPFNTKDLFKNNLCDLVLAEISYPATGQGIELGWANLLNIPIYCIYKKGQDVSGSALSISKKSFEYIDVKDMIEKLQKLKL